MPPTLTSEAAVLSGTFGSVGLYEEPTPSDRRQAKELLDAVDCGHLATTSWRVLSLGEQQRVLAARALMADPLLLIFDEPCAGLDLPGREALLDALDACMDRPETTVIYVTHHIEEILPRVTHVLALKAGNVLAQGPAEDVLRGDVLSRLYDLPVEVDRRHGRFWTRVRSPRAAARPGRALPR
jgi:iron complex transport system ATP-binding protein